MNEVLYAIEKRFSCRGYTGERLTQPQLEALATAAVQAPSAMNLQPWRVFVITNPGLLDELDAAGLEGLRGMEDQSAYERMMQRGGKLFYNAPCMLLVTAPEGNGLDCGIVCENIALAATGLGLGSVICGLAQLSFAGGKGAGFFERIGVPEGHQFAMAVLVGHAAQEGQPHTPDLEKIQYIP